MKTNKLKVCELTGAALDWAVAKCEGEDYTPVTTYSGIGQEFPPTNYSTDWAQGGPIIEREKISVRWDDMTLYGQIQNRWLAECEGLGYAVDAKTPLIAAMRCYVASKLGDDVEIPDELK